jgi:hypothetical protein
MELNISNKVKKLDLNSIKKQDNTIKEENITNNVNPYNKDSFGKYTD